ncbi:hypothetical protein [Morganella morganii]|uniref:hypothetical protein n=1 Tax=Morganella morganii TaxID=582 RepID=UPI001A1E0047|nr:hypothetical protein [Morganella morganii]MCU6224263.1 hypothetical protein [Morganella morganii]MCU6234502.1 hypothetical protein [Morganella morganii]HAT1526615.1 hypothetical protein [Morganella morganii]HDF2363123.1 hypothetical protein [Morganella morganii]HDF2422303.1 hypothetical protein [Morganella morganii]
MAGCFSSSPLSAGISSQTIIENYFSNISPPPILWKEIEDFFFKNKHDTARHFFSEFSNPDQKISRDALEGLFFQLIELAAPGYKNHFTVEENSSSEKCYYRITDKKGNYILSIYHGPIIISDAKSSWEQVICLRVSLMVKAQYRIA